jgi:hypothetical protein
LAIAGGTAATAVALSGVGGGSFTVTPTTLAFRNVDAGGSATLTATVTNTGSLPITPGAPTFTGTNAAMFTIPGGGNSCVSTLAPAATCTISVTFTPTGTPGAKSGTLNVPASGSSTQTASLTGTLGPSYTVSGNTGAFNFGTLAVGSTSATTRTVTITNSGTIAMPVAVALGGANPSDFLLTTTCPATVAAGANCTASVKFKPLSTGAKATNIVLTVTGASGSPQTLGSLTGTGQ